MIKFLSGVITGICLVFVFAAVETNIQKNMQRNPQRPMT